jgi:tetratricopeptide (TPR) repeat protein
VASVLDDPVGAGPLDEARPIIAGPVVAPGDELTGRDDGLPPIGLVLEQPLPADLVNLPIDERADELRRIAATSADPQRLLELGTVHQQRGDTPAARDAYRDALRLDAGNVAARVGLQMADAATGTAAQEAAADALDELAEELPDSQIVHFNRGWLDIYRREFDGALTSLRRAQEIDSSTPLGRTAAELVVRIEEGQAAAARERQSPDG